MLETALKVLKKIEDKGFNAYIVGGFVRDKLLGIDSPDVDITTNARPKDIKEIFNNVLLPDVKYGSVTLIINNIRFEVTTFRREIKYINNRKPIEIEYIDDLLEDLKRRDFTINTLCLDKDENLIDLLDGSVDITNKVIKTVGNPERKFEEDALRILRAIRFATVLNFEIDGKAKEAIWTAKSLLKNISYNRKKEELDKIFVSSNARYGIDLLIDLEVDKELDIYNLTDIKLGEDILGIWASLNVSDKYPFTNNEKELMSKIKEVVDIKEQTNMVLYKYGLYVNVLAANILGKDKKSIMRQFEVLPIASRRNIDITSGEISEIVKVNKGEIFKEVYGLLEESIVEGILSNDNMEIKEYLNKLYS